VTRKVDSGEILMYRERVMKTRAAQSYWYFSFPTPLAEEGVSVT
jgi:hypothetical protein